MQIPFGKAPLVNVVMMISKRCCADQGLGMTERLCPGYQTYLFHLTV
jgi:hypothetical protein